MHAFLLGIVLAQATPAVSPSASPSPSPSPSASPSPSPSPTSAATLGLSSSYVTLNPAQQQVITVTGATGPLQMTLERQLVNVSAKPDGTSVTITATQATGADVLHLVDAKGAHAELAIHVAFNAGTIAAQTTLTVTGDPVDPNWLAQQVTSWVTRLTQAMPGAEITVGSITPPSVPLQPGQSVRFAVPVEIAGKGEYFDRSGSTAVTVQNVSLQPFAPGLLFYDDDPEHVTQDGVLFRGTVTATQPARLYYYHDDALDPRTLVVALSSNSQDPTSAQLIDSSAGPNIDVMHVGQTVTKKFLLTKAYGEGVIVNLSQDEPYLLADVPMTARQLVAGTVDLRVLSGGPVVVTVLAVSPGVDPRALLDRAVLPGDGHHRTGVFQITGFGSDKLTYSAGGPDATVVIGDTEPTPPSVNPTAAGHDYGDYGIVHSIDVTLTNPGTTPAPAFLFFKPLAGPARGSFMIDGNLIDIGCVRLSTPYQISAFQLLPGQTYHASIRTMTDGGSFYPAQIGVTATPPQANAPPITAPDGCFPKPQAASN